MRRLIAGGAVAALLSGCTHDLGVTHLKKGEGGTGAVYVLPYTQYTVTASWRVVDCTKGAPQVALTATAISGAAPDGERAYAIDAASLNTWTSIGAFKATWPDGSLMLSTVNVSSEDRTGAIIGNVVTAATKIFMLGTPVRPAPGGGTPAAPVLKCKGPTERALASIATLKPELAGLTADIEVATAELSRLTTRATTLGASIDEASRKGLADQVDKLAGLQARQQTVSRQLTAALGRVTSVRTIRWPEDSLSTRSGTTAIDPNAITEWFENGSPTIAEVSMSIERVGSFGRAPTAGTLASHVEPSGGGLRYLTPAAGRLVVCDAMPCDSINRGTVLAELVGPVAQLGHLNVLPVRNRTFGSTVFNAEFTPMAGLRSVGYEQKAAPAEGASAALTSTAGALAEVLDPVARVQRQTAYLEALEARRVASEALQPNPLAGTISDRSALEADTALIEAQIAHLEAEVALARLRSAPGA